MEIFDLETKYLKAKEAYYSGEPIISDFEFDELEQELKNMDSEVIKMVGISDRNFKHEHLSNMLSLDKIQANLDNSIPMDTVEKWFSKFPKDTIFEATPKYDGMAINLIYRKGNLERAITRGDKTKGKDATQKLLRKIPLTIDSEMDVEVRGEIVIPFQTFYNKYLNHKDESVRKFKNPRNFVAGVINRDEISNDLLDEIRFMAVEVRIHDGDYDYPNNTQEFLQKQGFNKEDNFYLSFKAEEFQKVYDLMKFHRENDSPFQLDGFVIKAPEHLRKEMGENGHNPNWAWACKFPPKEATTTIIDLKYKVSITGEIIPGIVLEAVDLDGSTIRNTAGFNMGYIIKNGLFPGAKVTIAKSGDIIPIITKIITPNFNGVPPISCPCGKGAANLEGIHLMCSSEECDTKKLKKFIVGLGVYRLDKFGGVTRKTLFEAGYDEIWKIFEKTSFNETNLITTGFFKKGRTLEKLLQEIEKLKKVKLAQVILSLGFEGIGSTAAKEIAKFIRNQEYSFKGLEKIAVSGFEENSLKRNKIEHLVSVFELNGITIENETVISGGIPVEFTGSPKAAGISTKGELEKLLNNNGYYHEGLKKAKLLLTDSMSSPSSKMTEARKRGIEIMEYTTFVEMLKEKSI